MSVHGDQQDSGHQDEKEEYPPHPSAGHATHHSGESVNKREGEKLRLPELRGSNDRVSSRRSCRFTATLAIYLSCVNRFIIST